MTNFTKDASQSSTLRIANQTELDGLADCETLDGSIEISPDYVGSILLRGVKNLTGSFFFEINDSNRGTANITSLFLPDLEYVDTLSVMNVTMDSIYLPNATLINHLELYSLHGPDGTSLDFPVLANATTMYTCGTISRYLVSYSPSLKCHNLRLFQYGISATIKRQGNFTNLWKSLLLWIIWNTPTYQRYFPLTHWSYKPHSCGELYKVV